MKCIINGKVLLKDKILDRAAIVFDDKIKKIDRIENIDLSSYEVIDACGNFVAPGLIDMHIHGYLGADVSDGDINALKLMCKGIVENGVTSWCPTTETVSKREIETAFDTVRTVKASTEYYGSRILGINVEGPFINPAKKGGMAEEHILKPDADFVFKHKDIIKLITISPEVDGALDFIEKVKQNTDVILSIGHTNATYDEAMLGIDKGISHVTHLFNAMTGLSHRSPGVVGAALLSNASVELIADTFHVDKRLYNLVSRMKESKVCLITDCVRAGGMPDGNYLSCGLTIHKEGIKCLLPDGTIAGSVLRLNEAVYNLYANSDLELYEAVNCASLNPATVLGEDKEIGSIEVGKRADIIIADDKFNILKTILGGEIRYKGV